MKIMHISDLHIGINVNGYSFIEDQRYILTKILEIVDEELPDAVIIAGDVYDRTIPPAEAVEVFDSFLVNLSDRNISTFVISGNHDSAERLAFGNRLMGASGIHISPVYDGSVSKIELEDEYGAVDFYMLPFIKPSNVRRFFPDEEIKTYTDALRVAIENMSICWENRNVLITHQFVTGASRCDSEEIKVGGTDNVDASIFENFDYVALGHIHGPQNIGSARIRYCGTPLKYSFSEREHRKSVTIAELGAGRDFEVRQVELSPIRDLVEIKGSFEKIMDRKFYENTKYGEDYMHIILTDENDIPNAVNRLRMVYKNLMKLSYDNTRTRHNQEIDAVCNVDNKSELDLFQELYEAQNGSKMNDKQVEFVKGIIERIKETK